MNDCSPVGSVLYMCACLRARACVCACVRVGICARAMCWMHLLGYDTGGDDIGVISV